MATEADKVIAYERCLIGTPYRWAGHNPKTGLDCVGLQDVALQRTGHANLIAPVTPWTVRYLASYFKLTTTPKPGDLVFYKHPDGAYKHVAMISKPGYCIGAVIPHVAETKIGVQGVVKEYRTTGLWALGVPIVPPPTGTFYTVLPGDSLIKIARKFGTTASKVASLNGILITAIIHPGQSLRVI
jgi:hypothetical protein